MIAAPRTIEEARLRRYGVWAANPYGNLYVESRCAYEALDGERQKTVISRYRLVRQCEHGKGRGPGGLYCWQHAKKFGKQLMPL